MYLITFTMEFGWYNVNDYYYQSQVKQSVITPKMMDCDGNHQRWSKGIDRVTFSHVNIFIDTYSTVVQCILTYSPLTTGGLVAKLLIWDVEKLARSPLELFLSGIAFDTPSVFDDGPEPTTIQPLGVIAAAGGAFSLWRSSSRNWSATTPKLVSNCITRPWKPTTSSWNNKKIQFD